MRETEEKMNILENEVRALMAGGYDLHVHAYPSHFPRALDDIELARQMAEYKMAGAIIKNHYESTAGRALLANRYSDVNTKLYGAVALNRPVGGLNPYAVESAGKMGAKMVWLPTRDAANNMKGGSAKADFFERRPVEITDENGKLLPELYEVLEAAKKYHLCVATGHLNAQEDRMVCEAGMACGVQMIMTHPDWKKVKVPLEDQVTMARRGVLIEKVWGNVVNGYTTAEEMAASIRAIGPEQVFMVTDFGQKDSPMPVQGIHDFVRAMLENGIAEDEIRTMLCENPRRIVGSEK